MARVLLFYLSHHHKVLRTTEVKTRFDTCLISFLLFHSSRSWRRLCQKEMGCRKSCVYIIKPLLTRLVDRKGQASSLSSLATVVSQRKHCTICLSFVLKQKKTEECWNRTREPKYICSKFHREKVIFSARAFTGKHCVVSSCLFPSRGSEVVDYGVPYDFHDSEEESGLE